MTLKDDLKQIHDDWEAVQAGDVLSHAEKFACDIITLDQDAKATNTEDAKLIHHLLSTPFGAPFIGETNLLDAALTFDGSANSPLVHLLSNFKKYSPKFKSHIFNLFEEISNEMD